MGGHLEYWRPYWMFAALLNVGGHLRFCWPSWIEMPSLILVILYFGRHLEPWLPYEFRWSWTQSQQFQQLCLYPMYLDWKIEGGDCNRSWPLITLTCVLLSSMCIGFHPLWGYPRSWFFIGAHSFTQLEGICKKINHSFTKVDFCYFFYPLQTVLGCSRLDKP